MVYGKNKQKKNQIFFGFFSFYIKFWGGPGDPKKQKNQNFGPAILFLLGLALFWYI